ncbi:hypothetical protein [Burkholderia gladioli]|uniref:hypothetical protein n=1 Tax=Burkholderia gladioli TaxID=28095 RepID=UPI001641E113|nr:hypothetical protein [Burkholderia gladioli]
MSNQIEEMEIEGVNDGFYAIAKPTGSCPVVVVYHADDGEQAFTLPTVNWTAWQINRVIGVFEAAFGHGERYGVAKAQRMFREAVGLGHL